MTDPTHTDDSGYWFSAGERERDAGNFRQAQLCFERAAVLSPYNAVYWSELGLVMYENDESGADALRCIRHALELDLRCAAIWCAKGVILFRQGDPEAAVVAFQRATNLNPREADYWMNLGLAYAALEEYHPACQAFEIGIEIVPTDVSFWERKGTVLLALGEKERAEHCFANARRFA
jgi:tetratricopeptide (TPR) repeat protein